jgi:hypothetical protein
MVVAHPANNRQAENSSVRRTGIISNNHPILLVFSTSFHLIGWPAVAEAQVYQVVEARGPGVVVGLLPDRGC